MHPVLACVGTAWAAGLLHRLPVILANCWISPASLTSHLEWAFEGLLARYIAADDIVRCVSLFRLVSYVHFCNHHSCERGFPRIDVKGFLPTPAIWEHLNLQSPFTHSLIEGSEPERYFSLV